MKLLPVFIFIATIYPNVIFADSFLTAQQFPSGIQDLSFAQRMDVLSAGYLPFEKTFDDDGNCVSGCPYSGMTIQDEIKRDEQTATETAQIIQQDSETQFNNFGNVINQGAPSCDIHNHQTRYPNSTPIGEPLSGCPTITSKYGFRTHPVTGKIKSKHDAVDLAVPVGTNVFSPAAGTVVSAQNNPNADACGKYIKIKHDSGVYTLYCHLDQILVSQGDSVDAGCLVAKSGNTGRSTGAHLHYAVILSDGNASNPESWMTCQHNHKN